MSILKWTIGDVSIIRILEREGSWPINVIIPAATPEALAVHKKWLEPYFLNEKGHYKFSIQSLLIESLNKKIIVDTCQGEHDAPFFSGFNIVTRSFLDDLAAADFPRESIDVVFCTHLHLDHVGWNTMRSGTVWTPTFPNARYLFVRKEYEHCMAQPGHPYYSTFSSAVEPIVTHGLAELIELPYKITDEIWVRATPGHTPGHGSVYINSRGEQALITGDVTHHPVQWIEPDWGTVGDDYTIMASRTRRQLLQEHANRSHMIIGSHYPAPCAGRLETDGQETRFILST